MAGYPKGACDGERASRLINSMVMHRPLSQTTAQRDGDYLGTTGIFLGLTFERRGS